MNNPKSERTMQTSFLRNVARSFQGKSAFPLFLVILCSTVAVLIATWIDFPFDFDVDSKYYIAMAEGRIHNVIKPFSNRILHPIVVGILSNVFHLSTDISFIVVGIVSLVVLVGTVSLIARSSLPYSAIMSLLVSPFLLRLFRDLYLSDLFHAALLGMFFLCLFYHKAWQSLLFLFLLHLTRESTILLSLTIVILCLYRRHWKLALGSIIVALLGISISNYVASEGPSNIHVINDIAYLFFKVPYNLSKNILGLELWTNTLALNNPAAFSQQPQIVISVPSWLNLGAIHSLGLYSFNPLRPLSTLTVLLMTFGVLPSCVLSDLAGFRKRLFDESPLYILVALLYGLLSFVIGTSIGASVGRLIGYGWPCFWIAFPYMLQQYHHPDRIFLVKILFPHILASWFPIILASLFINSPFLNIAVLALLLVLHGIVFKRVFRK